MAIPQIHNLPLIVAADDRYILERFDSAVVRENLVMTQGDLVRLFVRVVVREDNPLSTRIWRDLRSEDYADFNGFRVALGVASGPRAGYFSMTLGANTAEFPYNASAAGVEEGLNGLASVAALGGVRVVAINSSGGPYQIIWKTAGAKTAFSVDASGLLPFMDTDFIQRAGTPTEQWTLNFSAKALCEALITTYAGSAGISITQETVGDATTREVQKVTFTRPFPTDGYFQLAQGTVVFEPLSYDVDAAALQAAITARADAVTVTGEFPTFVVEWDAVGAQTLLSVYDIGNLVSPVEAYGDLNLSGAGIAAALAADEYVEAFLEVVLLDPSDNNYTVARHPVRLYNDIII